MEYHRGSPFISVIIPVYNGEDQISDLLHCFSQQTYPSEYYELIIVDNGSRDRTFQKIKSIGPELDCRLELLIEDNMQGSYAARNKGLLKAKGEIIAFTDADCRPTKHWIEEGVKTLSTPGVDLAGGHVSFTFRKSKPNAAELVDSTTNMQTERDIAIRGITKTANLFTSRKVIEKIGPFPSELKSGGDVQWTKAATDAGFQLVFSPNAEVSHPARSWKEVFIKQLRVGKGHIPVMRRNGMTWKAILAESLQLSKPANKRFQSAHSKKPTTNQVSKPMKLIAKLWSRSGTLLGRVVWLCTHLHKLK